MVGRIVETVDLRRKDLRFPFAADFRARIEGRLVEKIDRRAKYLIFRLAGGDALVSHLGMSGSFRVEGPERSDPVAALYREVPRIDLHDHVLFGMSGGVRIVYNDPRRFGFMFVAAGAELGTHPRTRSIGLEPLDPPLTPSVLAARLANCSAPLKAALLDQKRVAGLGNIYVCEALHRARLSPYRSAATLAGPGRDARAMSVRLTESIRRVLTDAIEAGGSTLRDFSGADGKPGYFQHSFRVYDREGAACRTKGCSGSIMRVIQAGRSTFYCPECQS